MADEFDWNDQDCAKDIVFPSTQGVAVYRNDRNEIVIRQQAGPLDDTDTWVIVPAEHADLLVKAIKKAAES